MSDWAGRMLAGLERAKSAVVRADDVVPVLQKHARRAQAVSGLRGRSTNVSIRTQGTKVVVRASGPDAQRVMEQIRDQAVDDVYEVAHRRALDALSGIRRSL